MTTNAIVHQEKLGFEAYICVLSPSRDELYVSLAVFDVGTPGKSTSKGFSPVGWYPTNVRVVGKQIYVASGKGFTSLTNPKGPQPVSQAVRSESHLGEVRHPNSRLQYIGSLMQGSMSIIDEPSENSLALYSRKVYTNTPYKKDRELVVDGEAGNPIPMRVGQPSPIKHIFFILMENRTYDQVFGDIPEGKGDSTSCLFGEKYRPNQHKLAREFVLLDNFYVDAHRSPALLISPYVKRAFVDHTMYSTSGMLRTIELIAGLPPMTQYDVPTPRRSAFVRVMADKDDD